MKITKVSQLTGKTHTLEMNVTPEQMERFENRVKNGEYVQTIFAHLTVEEREFILSGIVQSEWNEIFN